MKAYILPSGVTVSPFNDPASQVLIRNRTIEQHQRATLEKAGFAVQPIRDLGEIDADSGLIVSDHLFFSSALLKKFLAAVGERTGVSVLALAKCGFTDFSAPLQDVRIEDAEGAARVVYGMYAFRGARPTASTLDGAARVTVAIEEKLQRNERVERLTEGKVRFDVYQTREFAFQITHWSHVLWANMYSLYEYWMTPSLRTWAWFVWGLLKAHSLNRWKIAGKLVRKGKRCDIHPSAVVEASVLGDGVRIGRHASVFGCWLGNGAEVADGAQLFGSVLGEHAVAGDGARFIFCVLYPRAFVSHYMQACLIGRGTMMTPYSYLLDMKMGKDIRVDYRGRRVPSGKQILGSCLGHGVFLGTGIWFEPGLEVPNGYVIVRDTEEVVREVPKGLPPGAPLIARGTTIMPRPAPKAPENATDAPPKPPSPAE